MKVYEYWRKTESRSKSYIKAKSKGRSGGSSRQTGFQY
jgi:hypothetical protein